MTVKKASTTELQRELQRRERSAGKLQTKRKTLLDQVAELDAELAALGVTPTGKGRRRSARTTTPRKRPKNTVTLPDAIAAAMEKGAVVTPKEAAKLVKANGYKTTSKTFGVQVAGALTKDKRFKRVGRGQYERVS